MFSPARGRRHRLGALVLTIGSLVLAACGGKGDTPLKAVGTTVASTTPSTTSASTTPPSTSSSTALGISGSRTPVPTTASQGVAATAIDQSFVPEYTASYSFRPLAMNGVTYPSAMRIESEQTAKKVEINAGRSRKRFLGSLGIPDDQKSSTSHLVEISLDNAPAVFSVVIRFGETKEIDLDVTDVLRIRITVASKTSDYSTYIAIGNPRFA